jgi:hydrogenase-4 component B
MNKESIFALGVPAILLLILGFFPYLTMNRLADLAQGFLHGEAPAQAVHYFSLGNLKGALISLTIGAVIYFGLIRNFLMSKEKGKKQVYLDLWPRWLDLEDRIYRPVLQAILAAAGCICGVIDRLYLTCSLLTILLNIGAFFSRCCDHLVDGILLFFRRTTHKSCTEQHVELIGTKFSRTAGTILDRIFLKNHSTGRSFVVIFAEWEEVVNKTNRLIGASLSFGLMLAAIGLALTLVYLLWW